MKCYNCESTSELKEWKFSGSKKTACKDCSEYFRDCCMCRRSVDMNDWLTDYEIVSEDKILCEKVVCEYCSKQGNLPREYYEKNKLSETQIAAKVENKRTHIRIENKKNKK
jgi:hypothetical protein